MNFFFGFQVLVELFGNNENAKKWLEVKRTSMVSSEEVIKHFYSQLTKEEIRGIHEKYRVDFELFGNFLTIAFNSVKNSSV